MCCSPNMCYTCLRKDGKEMINMSNTDTDRVTYFEKLNLCTQTELHDCSVKEICGVCVKQLRVTYEFLMMVRSSQRSLNTYIVELQDSLKLETEEATTDEPKEFTKNEEFIKDECSSDCFLADLIGKSDEGVEDQKSCEKCGKSQISDNGKHRCVQNETHPCDYCEQTFAKRWQLHKHRTRNHLTEKSCVCRYCGKSFKQSYHLNEHVASHTGEKKYECSFCDKKFHRLSSQRRHVRSHQAAPGQKTKRTPFLCSVCGKSFPFSNSVQRHMRVHLGIKRHECNVCQRKFNQSTHLQVHMRTHTGEKPYICHRCGEPFSLNSSLQKHMRVHQKLQPDRSVDNGYLVV